MVVCSKGGMDTVISLGCIMMDLSLWALYFLMLEEGALSCIPHGGGIRSRLIVQKKETYRIWDFELQNKNTDRLEIFNAIQTIYRFYKLQIQFTTVI